MFVFRGRQGDLIKIIWWDGQGACVAIVTRTNGKQWLAQPDLRVQWDRDHPDRPRISRASPAGS